MIKSINFTNYSDERARFRDGDDFADFLSRYGCDGVELLVVDPIEDTFIKKEQVQGIHLSSLNSWIEFWKGNLEQTVSDYGSLDAVKEIFGGVTKADLLHLYRKQLDYAKKIKAKYVVFHICDVNMEESFTKQFLHTDEEVIDCSVEFINELLAMGEYEFDFLMENLWWPGLTYLRPEIVGRLMDGIEYPKKGLVLDTGHLMNTNPELKNGEDALCYVNEILDGLGDKIRWIKEIHLNLSLSGEIAKETEKQHIILEESYEERFRQVFSYIFQLDQHRPFAVPGVADLIQRIDPKYLTFEFITQSREEMEHFLAIQTKFLS